jgi:hypothetical protein
MQMKAGFILSIIAVIIAVDLTAASASAQTCLRNMPNHEYQYSYRTNPGSPLSRGSVVGPVGGNKASLTRQYREALADCDFVKRYHGASENVRRGCRAHMTRIYESYYPRMCP